MTFQPNQSRRPNQPDDLRDALAQRRPLIFILIALCILFMAGYTARLAELRTKENNLLQTEQRLEDAQIKRRALLQELTDVRSRAHVEEVAVEQLDMALPDDQVVFLLDPPEVDAEAASDPAAEAARRSPRLPGGEPVWRQWVELFGGG